MYYTKLRHPVAFAPAALLTRCPPYALVKRDALSVFQNRPTAYSIGGFSRQPRTGWIFTTTPIASAENGRAQGNGSSTVHDEKAQRTIVDKTVYVESELLADADGKVGICLKAEDLGGRKRRYSGNVVIPANLDRVWRVITSYDRMEDFMPNIVSSVVHKRPTGLFLEQVGIISRKLMLRTRVLFRVDEDPSAFTILFTRIESRDFTYFIGKYYVEPMEDNLVRLCYQVTAIPFRLYPMALVENKALREVPRMLAAIRDEAVLAKCIPNPV